MNLSVIKNAVTSKVGRQILLAQKHSPTIMFAGGVVGVVGTTVLACKATLKLEEVLDEAQDLHEQADSTVHPDYSEADRAKDHRIITVRAAAKVTKLYAPAVAVGVISVAALTGSHVVLSRRNAAVMAAYSALDRGFNEYRERVRGEFGEEKDYEFRHGTTEVDEQVVGKDGKSKLVTKTVVAPDAPSIYARYFDEATSNKWQREWEYNQYFIQCQERYANDRLRSHGHLFLNEVYDWLGMPRTPEGQVVGWVYGGDGDNVVDFGLYAANNDRATAFVAGTERSILLDFNVDGVIYDLI